MLYRLIGFSTLHMVEKVTLENAIYVTVAIWYPLIENGCYPATMATVRRGAVV